MKIVIQNFKSIKEPQEFDINDINVITGVNSIGKTSLIQFLLLIKQSMENQKAQRPTLKLNKPYVSLGSYYDIITDMKIKEKLKFSFHVDVKNLKILSRNLKSNSNTNIVLEYEFKKGAKLIELDSLKYTLNTEDNIYYKFTRKKDDVFIIDTNDSDYTDKSTSDEYIVRFESFVPIFILSKQKNERYLRKRIKYATYVKNYMKDFFENISYIGPLRDEPHQIYIRDDDRDKVIGIKGEYTAQILNDEWRNRCKIIKYRNYEDFEFYDTEMYFYNSVKYWLCEQFEMAKSIKVTEEGNFINQIYLVNNNDREVPITHVGFGISQILPIIVEGIRLPKKGTLILEQPEIHLHPNIQALLFEFLYSLTLLGKKIIVETHSDHFITRMRRRIAEDQRKMVNKNINLYFIENKEGYADIVRLSLDRDANLDYWPNGFCDKIDMDYQKLLKAQINNRRQKNE